MGAWICADERLPEFDKDVFVAGEYIPTRDGKTSTVTAAWRKDLGWSSAEWRGITGITHWWDATAPEPTHREKLLRDLETIRHLHVAKHPAGQASITPWAVVELIDYCRELEARS